MGKTIFGAENYFNTGIKNLKGKKVALLSNQSSIVFDKYSTYEFLRKNNITLVKIFFPQHGFFQDKQDNMKESSDFIKDNINFISLYGNKLSPTDEDLEGIDVLIYDLQDTGTRIYTFVSTLYLLLKSLNGKNIKLMVLDRPNPISGGFTEGNIVERGYDSLVGIYPIPMVYGLTQGELALYFINKEKFDIDIEIIKMLNWKREMFFNDTGRFWYPPSPNMPFYTTTLVYPATVLLEGTNLSEGRGTTRPFEIIGAPFINSSELTDKLNSIGLEGIDFIPYSFTPTFNKYKDNYCEGVFLKINNVKTFKPYLTGIIILKKIRELYGDKLSWKKPPYEYEYKKLPIDIITGTNKIRNFIDSKNDLDIFELINTPKEYIKASKEFYLYN